MDKFWERYITTRPVNSKGAFDELVKMNQEPRNMNQGGLVDDLEPGALKDELLNDFDPFQETYEEYLQRKRLGERPFNMAEGGQLVKPSVDGSRPGYQGKDKPYFASEEFIKKRDAGKDIPKVRKYLTDILRRKDSIVFENIKDIMKKAGLPKTSKVDADVSRLLANEFEGTVTTKAKQKNLGQTKMFREILRDIKKTIPKGKKQFINVSYVAKKNKLPGKPDSGAYYRVLQEPEFKDVFVGLTKDNRSNPQIIRFAEEFEKLYAIQDIDQDFFAELAKNIYGNDKPDSIKKVTADASKYAEFLYGVRDVTDADGNKLKLPNVEKRGDYLFELIDETLALQEGEKGKVRPLKFGSGIERDRMLAVRDGLLGLNEGQTETHRRNIKKLLKKGYDLDEVAGIAATHEIAPGYTELVQGVKKKVNANKLTEIDKPFSRIFEQVITGQKPTKGFQYGKKFYQDINEVVKLYNKDAAAYGKKYNIDVPLIEYDPRPGKKLNPKNFLPNFKYLSPAAQANVKELADKGIGIRTGAFTMSQLETKDLNLSPKKQMEALKRMGYRCLKAGGGGETVECYMDDVKKTRADLKSSDVTVRAKALTKQRKALQVASKLPQIGKIVRQGLQAGAAGLSTAFKWTGLGAPIGYAIEGIVEGGIYDYYRKQGYNHDQAFAETFTPGLIAGRPEDVAWYGGAEKLREKELIGDPQQNPKVQQYVDALEEQDRIYDAIARKEGARDDYTLAEASADVQDLARSGAYRRVDQTLAPESMASQAYNIAVERQRALDERRKKEYMNEYYNVKEPSKFQQEKLQRDRYKEMNELFPDYSDEKIDDILAFYGEKKPDSLTYDQISDIFKDEDKTRYFADNFRMEKAGGGMVGIRKPSAIPPESGPQSQGLASLKKYGSYY